MTQPEIDKVLGKSTRCTQATLLAFGIEGYPLTGSGVLSYLCSNGYTLIHFPMFEGITLRRAKETIDFWHNSIPDDSSYLIQTRRHTIAIINGLLVDTMRQGFNGRKILNAWEVSRSIEGIR